MLSTAAPRRAAAVVLSLTSLGLAGHVAPGWAAWAAPTSLTATGVLGIAVIAAVAALWSGTRHRRTVGASLLLIGSALCALDAAGVSFAVASIGPAPYAILIAGATALAGIGILMRRRGARWLGLALAATGAMSSGINLAQWMLAGISDAYSWVLAVWTLGSLAVLVTLFGRDVAEEDRLAVHERVWARRDPLVRWMRAATVSAIAAVPMLIVYALGQAHAVPQLTGTAPVLAGFLAIGAFFSARGLLLGGALLALGAVALLAHSAAAVLMAPGELGVRIAAYYLVFWLPACVCGLGCGIALVRRAVATDR